MQADLFSAASLARTITIPAAPVLDIGRYQEWPFPGCTPRETAQAGVAISPEYSDMLAAVIKTQGGVNLSKQGLQALIPDEWRKLLGKYTHANCPRPHVDPRPRRRKSCRLIATNSDLRTDTDTQKKQATPAF